MSVSLAGDLLRYCDPNWVRRLGLGAAILFAGVLGGFGVGIVERIFILSGTSDMYISQMVIKTLRLAMGLIVLAGCWLLTVRDPGCAGKNQGTRNAVRILYLLVTANLAFDLAILTLELEPGLDHRLREVKAVIQLCNAAAIFVQLKYLAELAGRIPDSILADRANLLKTWLPSLLSAVLFLNALIVISIPDRNPPAPFLYAGPLSTASCLVEVLGLPLIVFVIMYVLMLIRFRRAFAREASHARTLWRGGQPLAF